MTAYYPVFFDLQWSDAPGGRLYTYASGTTTAKQTWADQAGTVANALPPEGGGAGILLDANGRPTVPVFLGTGEYTFKVLKADGSTLLTRDDVAGSGTDLLAALADPTSASNGDALLGVKLIVAGGKSRTQHDKNADAWREADFTSTDPSGATDSYAGLQAMLTASPGRIVTIGPGNFKTSAQLVGANGQTVVLEAGCTITATASMRSVFAWTDKMGVTVRGEGVIDCNSLAQSGVLFNSSASGCVDCTAKEITVKNTATDATLQFGGVEISSSSGLGGGIRGSRMSIIGCKFLNCGTHGAVAAYSDVVNFIGNEIDTVTNHGFEAVGCTDALESMNIVRNAGKSGLGVGSHTTVWAIRNNIIRNCNGDGSITCEHNSNNGSITDNEVYDANTQGINISYGTSGGTTFPYDTIRNITAKGNHLYSKSSNITSVGINCYATTGTLGTGIVIDGNTIDGFNKAITCSYLKGASVCDNTVPTLSGSASSVVEMTFCTGGSLEDNVCSGTTGDDAYRLLTYAGNVCDWISVKNNYVYIAGAAGVKSILYIEGAGHFPVAGNTTQTATSYINCAGNATIQMAGHFGPLIGNPISGAGSPIVLNSYGNYNAVSDFGTFGANNIYSGSGVPGAGLGANGNYYLRTDTPGTANQRLYVKSGGAWSGIL